MNTLRTLIAPFAPAAAVLTAGLLIATLTAHSFAETQSSQVGSLKIIATVVAHAHHHRT